MYIELKEDCHFLKSGSLSNFARIGRVTFSKTGKSIYYQEKCFARLKGMGGSKANYYDVETGEEYWISGCKKDGTDRLYNDRLPIEIDEDVRVKYWTGIRNAPDLIHKAKIN